MKSKTRKIAIAALSLTMAATVTASQLITYAYAPKAAAGGFGTADVTFTNVTGKVDTSQVVKNNLNPSVVDYGEEEEIRTITGTDATETVIVGLQVPSLAESKGEDQTVAEYLSTPAGRSAMSDVRNSQNAFLSKLGAAGISYKEEGRFSTVLNAVAIEVNLKQFQKIRGITGVSMAGVSKTYSALADQGAQVNPSNVHGTGIYDSTEFLDRYDGSGVTVAILDTGLDYTHVAFEKQPTELGFNREYVRQKVASGLLSASETSPSLTVDDVYLSDKVPFAYDYADKDTDVYPSYSQHGVHVAGIVAGSADTYVNKDGDIIGDDEGEEHFSGVAPNAQIVVCKVFTDDLESEDIGGATSEDIIAALDDCVTLGVDIINMSLGTTSGFSSVNIDGDAEGQLLNQTYQSIKDAGISLIAAAGNEYSSGSGSEFGTNLASNPDSSTVGSPSTFVGAMSVASINGQESDYMVGNPGEDSAYGDYPLYYTESNDANAVPFNFADELLGDKQSGIFTYYVIPGTGAQGDYSTTVRDALKNKKEGEKILVLVRRGTLDFQTKVENAHSLGADGIIVYDNVPGTIRMSLGEIEEEDRIPAVAINMDAGAMLTTDPQNPRRTRTSGTIEINKSYKAGPFMNDYSSWGASPDLKLKPDITSHGGEITSSVAGGYEQMSGTSMATPNLAGLMALVKDYLKDQNPGISAKALTTLTNQIVMSSATLVYDEEKLPYSPRKQGAGLATLSNIFSTKAYLETVENQDGGTEDNRPKIELGEDEDKKGIYNFTFYVTNFGESALEFELVSRFFTETIAADKLAVAEAAHMLTDNAAQFEVTDATREGNIITVEAGGKAKVSVTLTLSAAEKKYLDDNFKNGMFVEGFISLVSKTDGQCDLNLPFMGFYGDWDAAPMLDYNAYEIAAIEADTSLTEAEKPHESVFATQLYSTYYNGRYGVPMGGFAYVQDDTDGVRRVYVEEEHCSVSRYNIFNGATATDNYLTSTGIRSLYAGLLRNAEVVDYRIYNDDTGELIRADSKYRVGKAIAGGGSARPALVDLKLTPDELGLVNNGKYRIEFDFYRTQADKESGSVSYANNFTSTFYVDYDAPILEGSRIRYYDYEENNKIKQRVYLDLDIYDNHYPQAVLICYSDREYDDPSQVEEINLATEYVTPIYTPNKNGTTSVSIEITDIYEKYKNRMYVQIDDYALNHNVYTINFNSSNNNGAQDEFDFAESDRIVRKQGASASDVTYELTLEKNELYRVELNCGTANASNYTWNTVNVNTVAVKNNEIFGLKPGKATVTVTKGSQTRRLNVTVVDSSRTLPRPSLSFNVIQNSNLGLQKPNGMVEVNAGQTFTLEVVSDPWYYPVDSLTFTWSSSNTQIATVDQSGVVTTLNKHGNASIIAEATIDGSPVSAMVRLNVAEPFTVANTYLNKYHGSETTVIIPDDKNIMYIDEEAFEDNDTMERVVIPRTVTQISERAFLNCTALKEVYFINITDENSTPDKDLARVNLILADAFRGCTKLELVDLTNVKVLTVGASAFAGCESLREIRHMEKIGIADENAFRGCTSLKKADITGLHTAAANVFEGCTGLEEIVTDHYSAISQGMFYGCTGLENVTINTPRVSGGSRIFNFGGGAFQGCTNLTSVTFGGDNLDSRWSGTVFRIDPYAFAGCTNLSTVTFNYPVSYIGDYAFADTAIQNFTVPEGAVLGESVFDGKNVNITWGEGYTDDGGAVYNGTTLVLAPNTITAGFAIKAGTTEIAPYAFASSKLDGVTTVEIPASVEKIGEGAFAGLGITEITIPTSVTEIPAHAFRQSGLTSIVIHSGITSIGESAFADCSSLNNIDILHATSLTTIGSNAFSHTAISSIEFSASVKEMGDRVFANCANLTEAHLPSLTALGEYTFVGCPELTTASFGAQATASGTYTFCPGTHMDMQTGVQVGERTSLTSVSLGGLTELGEGMFLFCTELEEIDLKNVTKVGAGAFLSCTKLKSVTNLDKVIDIDYRAFGLTALTALNLSKAENIGNQAFYNVAATTLAIPVLKSVGENAFYGIQINSLTLPSTLQTYQNGAFANASRLSTVAVDGGNTTFFAEDNVLYRIIEGSKQSGKFEVCLYPAGRTATENENYFAHYRILEGTVTVQAQAFREIVDNRLLTVTVPHSVKTIGDLAFYGSNITRYNFEGTVAPVLLSNYWDLTTKNMPTFAFDAFHSLYFRNFTREILDYIPQYNGRETSTVVLAYPSNGTGYTNYTYGHFFGNTVSLGELIDENTHEFINLLDSFDQAEIAGWINLENTPENVAKITAFAQLVKDAHRIYNNTTSSKQLEFMGEDRIAKLTAVEEALKPVKAKFGISAKISSITPDSSSAHKSQYVEGETFDLTGLVLRVVYDDYSVETISDLTDVQLQPAYTAPLYTYNTFVAAQYKGEYFRIPITVTASAENPGETTDPGENPENPGETPEAPANSGCGGCGSMDIGSAAGGMGLMLLTLAGTILLINRLRRRANKK